MLKKNYKNGKKEKKIEKTPKKMKNPTWKD